MLKTPQRNLKMLYVQKSVAKALKVTVIANRNVIIVKLFFLPTL